MNGETVIVDASAVVAIYTGELDSVHLIERIAGYKQRLMSTATWLEAAMVCESAAPGGEADFSALISDLGIEVVPFTLAQTHLAFDAFKRFGKGRGAKAALNYGDCFVYALAKEAGAPVLFKDNDFAQTDIKAA